MQKGPDILDYSKEYNYIVVGPGASGKSYLCAKLWTVAEKLDDIDDAFFNMPNGAIAYCSINYSTNRLIGKVKGKQIVVIVCLCDMKVLRGRLTDRLYKRIKKYKNDSYFREAMKIFVENYTYDYSLLFDALKQHNIQYQVVKTG